jgi:hypothetical protein
MSLSFDRVPFPYNGATLASSSQLVTVVREMTSHRPATTTATARIYGACGHITRARMAEGSYSYGFQYEQKYITKTISMKGKTHSLT